MERIEKVFIEMLQTKKLSEISVSDICKLAGLNRTTFYAKLYRYLWIGRRDTG